MSSRNRPYHGLYANSSRDRIPPHVIAALAQTVPPEPWTLERVRVALGLRPWPEPFPHERGAGRTTMMLCEVAVKILNEPTNLPPRTFAIVAYTQRYADDLVHKLLRILTQHYRGRE